MPARKFIVSYVLHGTGDNRIKYTSEVTATSVKMAVGQVMRNFLDLSRIEILNVREEVIR